MPQTKSSSFCKIFTPVFKSCFFYILGEKFDRSKWSFKNLVLVQKWRGFSLHQRGPNCLNCYINSESGLVFHILPCYFETWSFRQGFSSTFLPCCSIFVKFVSDLGSFIYSCSVFILIRPWNVSPSIVLPIGTYCFDVPTAFRILRCQRILEER